MPDIWDVDLNCQLAISGELRPTGGLTFKDLRNPLCQTWIEINQPLTADTQSVSVSFTSSPRLYTPGRHGSGCPLHNSSTVGRVIRVQPVALPHVHEAIPLPTEVLLLLFQNFSESSDVNSQWRRSLLVCALVCKRWTCALDLLLKDFHYSGGRRPTACYPPEICRFANALALRPTLALSITHLSPDYFFRHPLWRFLSYKLDISESPFLPRPSRPPSERVRIERFVASFLSILRLARNLRSLTFTLRWNIGLPGDYLDAPRALDKIEAVEVTGRFNAVAAYLATWSSLKHLSMSILEPSSGRWNDPAPTTLPRYSLTDAILWSRCGDGHLSHILSSSSSSLERLKIARPDRLTHSGLRSVLYGVSRSLVVLHIGMGGSRPGINEEYVLDSVIVEMPRLKHLTITPVYATHRMIERRAEAFKRSHALDSPAALPVTSLLINACEIMPLRGWGSEKDGLLAAARQVWPGWEIKLLEPDVDP